MAAMSRCCICEKFSLPKCTCSIYPEKIPRDIFVELEECEYYSKKVFDEDEDEDLPIAKGR